MNDQPRLSHEEWDELAAAYALDALDPADAQRLAAHIPTCARCQRSLDDFTLIAAQLGSLADDEDPAPSWQRIRPKIIHENPAATESGAGAVGDEQSAPAGSGPVVPLQRPAPIWRRPRVLAAAAAVVVLLGAGIAGWQLGTRSSSAPTTAALTACQRQPGCRIVQLHDVRSGDKASDRAAVIVNAGRASLVPLKLTPAPAARMYVLWQMPRDGSPVAIATFRQTDAQTPSAPLTTAYGDTAAFAVSLEPKGASPTRPTDILALGAAPA